MPRTIHVTVTYSVHIEDDKISNKQAMEFAKNIPLKDINIFETKAKIFEKWKQEEKKVKKGIGSY